MRLFMVIETYINGPGPVYERFAERGRMLPFGLEYVDSWLEIPDRGGCYQLMRTNDPKLFDVWMSHWSDLVAFEVLEVEPSPTSRP